MLVDRALVGGGAVPANVLKVGVMRLAEELDRRWGWNRLPRPLAIITLVGLRMALRRKNLFDTSGIQVGWGPEQPVPNRSFARSVDGSGTDPIHPEMGSAESRFGRNVPLDGAYPNRVLEPNPRDVSNRLLARRQFIPADTLNVLAAAWIQFEVHDWMGHGTNEVDDPWSVELDRGDDFPAADRRMQIPRTRRDPTSDQRPPTFRNAQSHWWDASQVYGSSPAMADLLRTHEGGHLKLTASGALPFDPPNLPPTPGIELPGVAGWWLGLAMFHTLFMLEHNAICDHLAKSYPEWTDQQLYARGGSSSRR